MINETTGRRRVLLKLSGEAFGGGQLGVNPDVVSQMAREIAAAVDRVEIAVVVGGGNFFRGAELSQRGMDRGRADYMGMLGTVMNALALQDFLEQAGAATRVQSAISMTQVAEPYIPRRAERHMEKGRVVIFGAGAGLPVLLHRHGRRPAGARDRRAGGARRQERRRRRLHRGSQEGCHRHEDRPHHLHRRAAARAQGRRLDGVQPVHGQQDGHARVRHGARRQRDPRAAGRSRSARWSRPEQVAPDRLAPPIYAKETL